MLTLNTGIETPNAHNPEMDHYIMKDQLACGRLKWPVR